MSTNLRERCDYRTPGRTAFFAPRLPPLKPSEPTRRPATRRHWARAAACEAGSIAKLTLMIGISVVGTLVVHVDMILMGATFDRKLVAHDED